MSLYKFSLSCVLSIFLTTELSADAFDPYQRPSAEVAEITLPDHLQPNGRYGCLNHLFYAVDKAACEARISAILSSKNLSDCNAGTRKCLAYAFGLRGSDADLPERIEQFRAAEAQKFVRAGQRQAVENASTSDVETKTFIIDSKPVALPFLFKVTDDLFYSFGSPWMHVWTNLSPTETCPSQAFIFLEFFPVNSDQTPFDDWEESRWESIIVRTSNALGTRKGGEACLGYRSNELVFHTFDRENWIGSLVVPAFALEERKDGLDYIRDEYRSQLHSYAKQFSWKYN